MCEHSHATRPIHAAPPQRRPALPPPPARLAAYEIDLLVRRAAAGRVHVPLAVQLAEGGHEVLELSLIHI